ncbi:MAG: GTPase ObgE [Candidatus Peribacteraceae bacterium]
MFIDDITIDLQAGNGGKGCVAWRREKFVPRGGPDGGDGGRGGDIVVVADSNTDTLSSYASRKRFTAKHGEPGGGKKMAGADAPDLLLPVPPGTTVSRSSGDVSIPLMDLVKDGDKVVVSRGGRGGYGNAHFTTSTRQAPDFAELGEPGENVRIHLELKLVADVGIIGYPSVGKSSLIAAVSRARPKIADYPFTTLVPNLGVVQTKGREFVLCDVPGLIEGASEGKGLGHTFLKHVERCGILLHLLDVSREDIVSDYKAIRAELEKYSPTLAKKKEIVVLSKSDMVGNDTASWVELLKENNIECFGSVSAATRYGTEDLLAALLPMVLEERKRRQVEREESTGEMPTITMDDIGGKMGSYQVNRDEESAQITGRRLEQLTKMTNFASAGGKSRYIDVLKKIGLLPTIKKDIEAGLDVYVGETQINNIFE